MEQELDLESLSPADAVRRIVEFTFDYQETHPDFIRLVSIENIHHGKHLAKSERLRELNTSAIQRLREILQRGRRAGDFRSGIDPVDLHMLISAFCFFRVSNRHTFGALFGWDLTTPKLRKKHKRMIGDAIVGLLMSGNRATSVAEQMQIAIGGKPVKASGVRAQTSRR